MHLLNNLIAWLYWDPTKDAFTLPFIDRPVAWYGIFFAFGFLVGYLLIIPIIKKKLLQLNAQNSDKLSIKLADRLTWFIILGTVIGARLGEVFFYDWHYYKDHLLDILKVWNGGLASHGGTLGVLIAIFLFQKTTKPKIPFLQLIDMVALPTAFVICCIRIGNFFNQEIIGIQTTVPWAIIFGHPADGSPPLPRHATQLYEAFTYLITFLLLQPISKLPTKPGFTCGLFLTIVFSSRFLIEFLKLPLSSLINESTFHMGQYLSIPFILLGLFLILRPEGEGLYPSEGPLPLHPAKGPLGPLETHFLLFL